MDIVFKLQIVTMRTLITSSLDYISAPTEAKFLYHFASHRTLPNAYLKYDFGQFLFL
jgi:hypothetical protein